MTFALKRELDLSSYSVLATNFFDTIRPYKDVQNLLLQSLVLLGYKLCLRKALDMNEKISERLYKKLWATSSSYFMHDDGSV